MARVDEPAVRKKGPSQFEDMLAAFRERRRQIERAAIDDRDREMLLIELDRQQSSEMTRMVRGGGA